MRLLFVLASCGTLVAQSYTPGVALLLDSGVDTITAHGYRDKVSTDADDYQIYARCGAGERVKVWAHYSPIPRYFATQACTGTCNDLQITRQYGEVYRWHECVDSSGNSFAPPKVSAKHVIPPKLDAASSTLALPVIMTGGTNYEKGFNFTYSGTPPENLRIYLRLHNITHELKASYRINSGASTYISNANTPQIDNRRHWGGIGQPGALLGEFAGSISNGTIVNGSNTIWFKFHFARERSLGYRIMRWNVLEPNVAMTQIVVSGTGTLATATTGAAHGYSSNDWVMILNAPGMYGRFCGPRQITVTGSTTFTFALANDPDGNPIPDGTYTVPTPFGTYPLTNSFYSLKTGTPTTSVNAPSMHAARMLIPQSSFTFLNPASDPEWAAPSVDSGDIAVGEALWKGTSEHTSDPYFNYQIPVGCHDCHFESGKDMNYFRYENRTLMMAGLRTGHSVEQSEQIISYLRSLPAGPTGTWPWSPAFQRGPGLLAKITANPLTLMAGCGIDCIANYDHDLREYALKLDATGDLGPEGWMSKLDTPALAHYLPWNNWINAYHPKLADPSFNTRSTYTRYSTTRTNLNSTPTCAALYSGVLDPGVFWSFDQKITLRYLLWPWFETESVSPLNKEWMVSSDTSGGQVQYWWYEWSALKGIEVMHEYDLFDCMDTYYTNRFGTQNFENRQYIGTPGISYIIYNIGPHKNNKYPDSRTQLVGGNYRSYTHVYLSYIWYDLGIALDAGNRFSQGDNPIDWPYHHAFLSLAPLYGRSWQRLLDFAYNLQASAQLQPHTGPAPDTSGMFRVDFTFDLPNAGYRSAILMSNAELDEWATLWTTKVLNPQLARFTPAQWATPSWMACSTSSAVNPSQVCAWMYHIVAYLRFVGVSDTDTQPLVDWGNAIWGAGGIREAPGGGMNFTTRRAASANCTRSSTTGQVNCDF